MDASDDKRREEARRAELARREEVAKKPNMPPATEALKTPAANDNVEGEESPPRELGHAQWHASSDAREVVGHAVTRIPRQHLSLVLAEIAEQLWPLFHEEFPNDWGPAWCIATLRAWCFGEATLEEVRSARLAAKRSSARRGPAGFSPPAYAAARTACVAAIYASDEGIEFNCADAAEDVLSYADARRHSATFRAVAMAVSVSEDSESPVGRSFTDFTYTEDLDQRFIKPIDRESNAQLAEFLRERIAWPARASERWEVHDGYVQSGDSQLVIEHGRIVDVRPFMPERRGRVARAN